MKPIKVAVYLQDYFSEDGGDHLNNTEMTLIKHINDEPSWIYTSTFKDCDRNFPSYHLERLVREAKKQSIDIILVGSLSKFNESLNNAVDTIDEIFSIGIRLIFFEEGIDSSTDEGRMLINKLKSTLEIEKKLASVSRKWTFDKMYEKGHVIFVRLLGYKKVDDQWVIVPEEAEIVREAFTLHLEGLSLLQIARRFISKKYKKANGRMDWTSTAIKNIIKNERYTGDVLCRKTISNQDITDGFKIKTKQYLLKNHHEGIISHEDFEKANKLLWQGVKGEDRGEIPKYPFSTKLKCSLCGANFQRSQSKEKVFWRCGTHTKSKSLCPMTGINEENIKKAIMKAFFDKFNDGVKDLNILLDFLRGAEAFKEDYVDPLVERLDQIIEEENYIVLHGEINKLDELKREKVEIEELLEARIKTLKVIEKDYSSRMKSIGILNKLLDQGGKVANLQKVFNDFWLLRAFIVRVTIISRELYDIEWIDNKHSVVDIEVGD